MLLFAASTNLSYCTFTYANRAKPAHTLNPARQVGTPFTYLGRLKGWVNLDVGYTPSRDVNFREFYFSIREFLFPGLDEFSELHNVHPTHLLDVQRTTVDNQRNLWIDFPLIGCLLQALRDIVSCMTLPWNNSPALVSSTSSHPWYNCLWRLRTSHWLS